MRMEEIRMKNQCLICKNVIKDKERDEVRTCTLSAALNNPSLIILGAKGCCPYHEYPEYYGMK